jgi:hypothetical protein
MPDASLHEEGEGSGGEGRESSGGDLGGSRDDGGGGSSGGGSTGGGSDNDVGVLYRWGQGQCPRESNAGSEVLTFAPKMNTDGPARTEASATEGPEVRTTSGKEKG